MSQLLALAASSSAVLEEYRFQLKRKLLSSDDPRLELLFQEVQHELDKLKRLLKNPKISKVEPAVLLSKRIALQHDFQHIRKMYEEMLGNKPRPPQNMLVKESRHSSVYTKPRPYSAKTKKYVLPQGQREAEEMGLQLLCAEQLRKQIAEISSQIKELGKAFSKHKHPYDQQLQKLSIENSRLIKLVDEARQDNESLRRLGGRGVVPRRKERYL